MREDAPPNFFLGRPRTYLTIVLDKSGSMRGVADTTIDAYNNFIQQQRDLSLQTKDEVFVTLLTVDDVVDTIYVQVPLDKVTRLSRDTYAPDGSTALYDGVGVGILTTEQAVGVKARVLMLVITDGQDNASRRLDIDGLKRLVQERDERGNWTFVFLSAGDNPFAYAANMGFKPGNTSSYAAAQVAGALARTGAAVQSYRTGDALQTETFWAGEPEKHERPNWTTTGVDDVEDIV